MLEPLKPETAGLVAVATDPRWLVQPAGKLRTRRGRRFSITTDPVMDRGVDGDIVTRTMAFAEVQPEVQEITVPEALPDGGSGAAREEGGLRCCGMTGWWPWTT